jgi:hypothetical protein
LSRAGKL